MISTFLKTKCVAKKNLKSTNIRICTSLTLNQRQNANTVDKPQYSTAVHILNLRALEKNMIFSEKTKQNTVQHLSPCAANQNLSVTWSRALVSNHMSLQKISGGNVHISSKQPCNSTTRIITTELKNSYIHLWVPYAVFLPSGTVVVPVPLGTRPCGCSRGGPADLATKDFVSINNFITCQTFFHVNLIANQRTDVSTPQWKNQMLKYPFSVYPTVLPRRAFWTKRKTW